MKEYLVPDTGELTSLKGIEVGDRLRVRNLMNGQIANLADRGQF
jgi:hypothetical protein